MCRDRRGARTAQDAAGHLRFYQRVGPTRWAARFRGIEPLEELELELVAGLLRGGGGPNGARRVLDVGCGTGRASRLFLHDRYIGLDRVPALVGYARSHAAGREHGFVVGELDALPFAPGSFDVVVLLGTLESERDVTGRARRLAALLRPGGRLLFTVQNGRHWPTRAATVLPLRYKQTYWSGPALARLLRAEWEEVRMTSMFLLPPGAARAMLRPLVWAAPLRYAVLRGLLALERLNARRNLGLGYEWIVCCRGFAGPVG